MTIENSNDSRKGAKDAKFGEIGKFFNFAPWRLGGKKFPNFLPHILRCTKIPLLMGDGLRRNAYKFPVKLAARDRFRRITYSELNARVNQLAHGLVSLGVRQGDSVAVLVGNRIEHLEILFATAKIGALAIPLDIKWKALELGSVVSFFKPAVLILQQECVAEFEIAKSTRV